MKYRNVAALFVIAKQKETKQAMQRWAMRYSGKLLARLGEEHHASAAFLLGLGQDRPSGHTFVGQPAKFRTPAKPQERAQQKAQDKPQERQMARATQTGIPPVQNLPAKPYPIVRFKNEPQPRAGFDEEEDEPDKWEDQLTPAVDLTLLSKRTAPQGTAQPKTVARK